MNPTSWLPRNLSRAELLLIRSLERRRLANRGRLFALIADPGRKYRRICALYLAWLQRYAMPDANAAVGLPRISDPDVPRLSMRRLSLFLGSAPVVPVRHYPRQLREDPSARRGDLFAIPRALFFSARNPDSLRGVTFSQLLIDRADTIAPSRPYWCGIFTVLPAACYPALPLAGPYVCLILGDPYHRRHNHFRRYWLHLARSNPDCILLEPDVDLAARRSRALAARRAIDLRRRRLAATKFLFPRRASASPHPPNPPNDPTDLTLLLIRPLPIRAAAA